MKKILKFFLLRIKENENKTSEIYLHIYYNTKYTSTLVFCNDHRLMYLSCHLVHISCHP